MYQNVRRYRKVKIIVYTIIVMTIAVSAYLTVVMISNNIFISKAQEFIQQEMNFPNTQVLSHKEYISDGKRHIDVVLIGEALPKDSLQLALMTRLDSVGLGGTVLNVKQGFSLTTREINDEEDYEKFYALMQAQLSDRQMEIDSLRTLLRSVRMYADISRHISPEVKVLFPSVRDIAVAQMVASSVSGSAADTLNMVFVNAPSGLSRSDRTKLSEFIGVRLSEPDIHLTVNPAGFPWPSQH